MRLYCRICSTESLLCDYSLTIFFYNPLAKDGIRLIFQFIAYKFSINHVMAHALLFCIPKIPGPRILAI